MNIVATRPPAFLLRERTYLDLEELDDCPAGSPSQRPLHVIAARVREAHQHFAFPVSRTSPVQRFQQLATTWKSEAALLSSATEIAMHPAYQEIIGMGEEAVPYILADLRDEPAHWFWALRSITGVNPVKPEQRGRLKEMTHAWLQWGRERGYC